MADDKTTGASGSGAGRAPAPTPGGRAVPVFGGIVVAVVLGVLLSVSMFKSSQSKDQAGQVLGQNSTKDGLIAEANIIGVDPAKNEMQVRLTLNPEGSYDDDGLLARPVVLYYDTLNGTKQVDFKAKKPLGSVDLSIPLVGDTVSSYPWDTYESEIELLFLTSSKAAGGSPSPAGAGGGDKATTPTTPVAPAPDSGASTTVTVAPATPGGGSTPGSAPEGEGDASVPAPTVKPASFARPAALGAAQQADPKAAGSSGSGSSSSKELSADDYDTIVPLSLTVYRSVPAYTVVEVAGSTKDAQGNEGVVHANFTVKRAATAIAFSVAVSLVMWCLALGVLFLAVSVISRRRKLELTHISVMAVVMFALPAALRSFQPGIPPPGVLSDFYSFFWCDVIVGASLISTLATYVIRKPE